MLSVSLCNMFIHCGVPSITKPCIEIYLQKIASLINLQLPIVILKQKWLFRKCFIVLCTCISIFRKIGFFRLVKTVHTNLFAKKHRKLQFEFRKIALFSDMHFPTLTFSPNSINWSISYCATKPQIYFHEQQTDGQTSKTTTIGIVIAATLT